MLVNKTDQARVQGGLWWRTGFSADAVDAAALGSLRGRRGTW